MFLVGLVFSFVSAWLCVRWLLRYISSHSFTPFAWYRIAFGIIVLADFRGRLGALAGVSARRAAPIGPPASFRLRQPVGDDAQHIRMRGHAQVAGVHGARSRPRARAAPGSRAS